MILVLSYDVRRRGGIERLSLQVQASLRRQGRAVRLLTPRRLGPGPLGRFLGRGRFLLELILWLPQSDTVLSMHALLLQPLGWLAGLLRWVPGAPQAPGGSAGCTALRSGARRCRWWHRIFRPAIS